MAAIYLIGRDAAKADIVIGAEGESVSRVHAELHDNGADRFTVVDLKSSNGTEVLENGQWRRIDKVVVGGDARVRFARSHESVVRDLAVLGLERQSRRSGATSRSTAQPSAEPTIKPADPSAANTASVRAGSPRPPSAQVPRQPDGAHTSVAGAAARDQRDGLFHVIAQDAYAFGNRGGLLPVIMQLLRAPIDATVAYANDAGFKLHWPLFGLGILIYVGLAEAIDANFGGRPLFFDTAPLYIALGDLVPPIRLLPQKVVFFGFIYALFLFSFVISYSVFRDYSRRPRSARSYLRLCCITSFMIQLAYTALLLPFAAAATRMITDPINLQKVFLPIFLAVIAFTLQYLLRTTMRFWDISLVSAFRGMLTAFVLAAIALMLILGGLAMINVIITLWSGGKP